MLQYNVLQPLESETHPHPFRAPLPTAPQPLTQEDRDPEELVLFSSICPPIVSNVFKKENKTLLLAFRKKGSREADRQGGNRAGFNKREAGKLWASNKERWEGLGSCPRVGRGPQGFGGDQEAIAH